MGEGLIVNTWRGSGGGTAQGLEIWRFEAAGQVRQHRISSFLGVRPVAHWIARVKFALGAPRTAVTLLREQRRLRVRPR